MEFSAVSLKIETVGDREALASLQSLDAAGRRIVNSVSGYTGKAMGDVAAAFQRAGAAGQDAFRSVAVRADMATDATKRLSAATGGHGLQVGRLRMELGTLIGRLTGTSTAMDRMGAAMGAMTLGEGAVIAGMVGVAAGVLVWKAWHENVGKAAEEQKKLTDSLLKWYDTQKLGRDGLLLKEIDAMTTHVKALKKEMDDVMAHKFMASLGVVGEGGSKLMGWVRALSSFASGGAFGAAAQLGYEVAGGAASVAGQIKKGGDTVVAAHAEVAKRIQEQNDKDQKEYLDAYNKRFAERIRLEETLVQGMVARLSNADAKGIAPIERINRAANRDDAARGVGKLNLELPDMKQLHGDIVEAGREAVDGIKDNPFLKEQAAFDKSVKDLAKHMHEELGRTLGAGISAGFEVAFSGKGIGEGFKALTSTVLSGLGSFLEQLGAGMLITGTWLTAFSAAMHSLNGPGAIAAGVGLIAAGAALKAIAGSFGGGAGTSNGGTSFSTGGTSSYAPATLSFPVTASTSQAAPAAMRPLSFTIIGDGPKVQRDIAKIVNGANDRGLLNI